MTDDPIRPPDLKALWKDQRLEIPPVTVETVRRNARRLQRRRLRVMIQETLGASALIVLAGLAIRLRGLQPWALDLSDVAIDAGMGLAILWAVFYAWRVLVLFRPRRVPDDAAACLDFHRRELERQRDIVRGLWRWAIVPLLPVMILLFVGLWLGSPAPGRAPWLHHLPILAAVAFQLESLVLVWLWQQHRADRLQDQIDALDALGKEEAR
jgi:hypothetical protein